MTDLREQIAEAIKANDKERLKLLRHQLKLEMWLNRFDRSVPPSAWLEPNPIITFE